MTLPRRPFLALLAALVVGGCADSPTERTAGPTPTRVARTAAVGDRFVIRTPGFFPDDTELLVLDYMEYESPWACALGKYEFVGGGEFPAQHLMEDFDPEAMSGLAALDASVVLAPRTRIRVRIIIGVPESPDDEPGAVPCNGFNVYDAEVVEILGR